MKKLKDTGGFTLMETLLAMGLLSLAVLFSTAFLITVIQTNTFSQNRTGALALAQEKLEDLKAGPHPPAQNEMVSGLTTGNLKTLFSRETRVTRLAGGEGSLIEVRITWLGNNGQQQHQVQLATQLAD